MNSKVRLLTPLLVCALAVGAASGCSGVLFSGMNALSGDSSLIVTDGVPFDAANQLFLDVYQPQGVTKAPVVVFFYGGNWRSGERGNYRWVGEALAREGVVAIVPDYRKFPAVGLDGFMSDAARAVAWASEHAADHGGDPQRIVLMGHSAGAQLAALLATDASWLKPHGIVPKSLCGMVGLAGPYDFLPLTSASLREVFGEDPAGQQRSQPIRFVDGDEPPMLLLHGAADTTVGQHNTENLEQALTGAGVRVQTRIYPEVKHVGMLLALSGRFGKDAPVMADSMAFIRNCP